MPIGNVNRGKYRVFVGNTQEISKAEVHEEFSKFGNVIEVDLKGAYGFVGYDVEEEAKAAVAEMDRKDFKGRQLNVEISGGRPRTNLKNGKDTTKLHVSGIGYDADLDQLREIFSEFGTVVDIHPMQGKDICFLHMDEKSAEHAMVGATGKPFGSHKIKVEYGSLSKKPIYDKHSRKIILHVANLPDASLDHPDILRKKFDLFGSVEDAQVIKSKHIAFIKIDEKYAERAVESLNNCYFFGKQIKVQYSKQNPNSSSSSNQGSLPSGLSGINADIATISRISSGGGSSQFVIDDFSQLSGNRPNIPLPRSSEIESLVNRRKRLETIHPYERTLLNYPPDSRDFPPPPPEFLRLVRDRAEIKAQLLIYQASQDGKLSLLSRADDEYGFNSAGRSRSPPPRHYGRSSYDDRTRDYPPVRSYEDRGGRSDAMPSRYSSYKASDHPYKTEGRSDYRSDSAYKTASPPPSRAYPPSNSSYNNARF